MAYRKKSKSPYQKYRKTPYRYSDLFNRWREALLAGKNGLARQLGEEHSARFLHGRPATE